GRWTHQTVGVACGRPWAARFRALTAVSSGSSGRSKSGHLSQLPVRGARFWRLMNTRLVVEFAGVGALDKRGPFVGREFEDSAVWVFAVSYHPTIGRVAHFNACTAIIGKCRFIPGGSGLTHLLNSSDIVAAIPSLVWLGVHAMFHRSRKSCSHV